MSYKTTLIGIRGKQVGQLGNDLRSERPLPTNRFKVDEILSQMSEQDREDLLAAVLDPTVSIALITRVLRRHGYVLSDNAVRHYRRAHNAI